MSTPRHPTWTLSFRQRAALPDTPLLAAYLLRLIAIKHTNLCLSADVTTTAELLNLAEEVGDSICLLKTHADIISDFGDRTIKGLLDIARRKRFLIFEDRKFADIGGTVQKQYTGGPLRIARWAEITNAHILPGPAIVTALQEAAKHAVAAYTSAVHTEISASPSDDADSESEHIVPNALATPKGTIDSRSAPVDRKHSVVSISTTISTITENIPPLSTADIDDGLIDMDNALAQLGDPPFSRVLLLLAEMSSEGHLLTGTYTEKCVEIARKHRDFVIGFIAQHSLNIEPSDNFITMTPGVQLPPPGQEGKKLGDSLGQQYNTPRKLVYDHGCDIVIVGRGIVNAENRSDEAERYRVEAWEAYKDRLSLQYQHT